jgi:hypothetical protein
MQTMLFVTLLRMNGIGAVAVGVNSVRLPAACTLIMVYFRTVWMAADGLTYGRQVSEDEAMKYFYVNGMDSYRLIFNDAVASPFYPAKIHRDPRPSIPARRSGMAEKSLLRQVGLGHGVEGAEPVKTRIGL